MKKYCNCYPKYSFLILLFIGSFFLSCKNQKESRVINSNVTSVNHSAQKSSPFFKLSLAEWSLHLPIQNKKFNPMNFAEKAHELGFEGLEYVSQFYTNRFQNADNPQAAFQKMLDTLKQKSDQYHLQNVLIMVDNEGELASSNETARNEAVENHKKWVDAASFLGCHSIRVNLFGSENAEEWKKNSIDGINKLASYAAPKNINILVENHGGFSSNANLLTEVMQGVSKKNHGTLPDFGNFCLKREGGARWNAKCVEEFPRYEGIKEMMPFAQGVSAKSYHFNEEGQETLIDYSKMMEIVKNSGYTGFVGVEYEGEDLPPEEGILKTKELLLNSQSN